MPVVVVAVSLFAHSGSPQSADQRPIFRSTTAAVTVDVVVRDRAGRPVEGLTSDDFEVLENGVAQRILSVDARHSLVQGGTEREPAEAGPLLREGSSAQAIVALVFHQLSHQPRAAATRAARAMIDSLAPDEYVGVFDVNLSLTVASPFTRDRAALRRALDRVLRSPPVQTRASVSGTGVAETSGPPGQFSAADAIASGMMARMAADAEGAHRGAVQSASLNEVVAHLARFPGRKAVVLFSEGLMVSPRLESVVVRALAENVTVYTVHAGGLMTPRSGRFTLPDRSIDRGELTSTNRRGREAWRIGFLEIDPTAGLGPLAKNTGGFFVSDTNDLQAALASINTDRHAYYVLAYSSSNTALDGTTRQIEVRVKRSGVSVRARTGYVAAAPDVAGRPSSEEDRALAALSRMPRPRDFEFFVRVYRTPTPEQPSLVSVVVEVPARALTFQEDGTLKRYQAQLSVLTRLNGPSAAAVTQHRLYNLTGDLDRLVQFRQRPLSYFRTMTVPPGSHRLEVAVRDTIADRTSTTELHVVSEPTREVSLGDLIIVRDVNQDRRKDASAHPFGSGGAIVMPRLDGIVPRGTKLLLAIPVAAPGRVTGRLALSRDTIALADVPVSFESAATGGSILRFVELPIGDLPPGTYALTLTADVPAQPLVRRTTFLVR